MKRMIVLGTALLGTLWTLLLFLSPAISTDTPVVVVAADDVIVLLPVSPSVDRIVADLTVAFAEMSSASTDSRVTDALDRFAADSDLLRQVATTPADMFDNGQAAATATPIFDVSLDPEQVTLVVTTVELVPGYGATAISRDHEDGHALINRAIASRCADEALAASLATGRRGGEQLIDGIIGFIATVSDEAHARYHDYVAGAGYGQHTAHAWTALNETERCR